MLADGSDGIPHGVVHGIVVALGALGEALRRIGDALEGRCHVGESFGKAARAFGSALLGGLELLAVGVAEIEGGVPLAELVGEAGFLCVSVVAGALAAAGDGVPLAVVAGFAGGFGSSSGGDVAASGAGASSGVPLADTRVGGADGVSDGAVAGRDAATSVGIPDAIGVGVTEVSGGVSVGALGAAGGAAPFANGGFLALVGGKTGARLCADASDGVPSAAGVEVASGLVEVGGFALLLALRCGGDPTAAGLSDAGGLAGDETASLLADGLLGVPLTFDVVDARTRGGEFLVAADTAVV